MTEYVWSIFQPGGGDALEVNTGTASFGLTFYLTQDARVTGIWWYSPSSATVLPSACGIFLVSTGAAVLVNEDPTWSGDAGSGWVKCTFDGTFPLFADEWYTVAAYNASIANFYAQTSAFFTTGVGGINASSGIFIVPNNADAPNGQGTYTNDTGLSFPNTSAGGNNYWVDIEVTTGIPAPSPPVTGFTLTAPRNWNPADLVTTPRLRADMYNLSSMISAGAGPIFWAFIQSQSFTDNTVELMNFNSPQANSWNTILTQGPSIAANPGTAVFYPVPLPGWYLLQAYVGLQPSPASDGEAKTEYIGGMIYTQGTALFATREDFTQMCGPPAGTFAAAFVGNSSAELVPLSPNSGDVVGVYGYTAFSDGATANGEWGVEWVGLPSAGTINGVAYTGPTGVVVPSPKPATLWPAGPGVTLQAAATAGAGSVILPPTPGLRAGQIIGLDYQQGQLSQPYGETATVSAIAGTVVTLDSPTTYAHSSGAPVAVPVSAALLNEQIRDQVNFWFYPPMLRAIQGSASAQSVTTSTWTTVNLALTGAGITNTLDNFNGWAATTANSYTIPVSGLYLIIGQVYFVGSTAASTNWGVALIDNTGVRYPGDFFTSDSTAGAIPVAPSVRRLLRLTAGQTIALQCWQSSGASVNTDPQQQFSAGSVVLYAPRLIVIFRAF